MGKKPCKSYFRVSFNSTFKALDILDCSSLMANSDLGDGCDCFILAVPDVAESPSVSSLMLLLDFSSTFSKFYKKTFCLLLYVMLCFDFLTAEDRKTLTLGRLSKEVAHRICFGGRFGF